MIRNSNHPSKSISSTVVSHSKAIDFTLVSYNVLKPTNSKLIRLLLSPETRYAYHFETLFPSLEPEVICVQEWSDLYIQMLENSSFYKTGYTHTEIPEVLRDDHFPMIISKLPMKVHYNDGYFVFWEISLKRKDTQNKNIIVISAHLTAYEDRLAKRKSEMEILNKKLAWLQDKLKTENGHKKDLDVFLLGDLNLHLPCENEICDNYGFHDLWLERHSHYHGYSWDARENSMINLMLPLDNRRMRLDRICMKNSQDISLDDIELIGTQRLPRICLYPSDHFGLVARFKFTDEGFDGTKDNKFKQEFMTVPKFETGYRSVKTIVFYRIMIFIALVLLTFWLLIKIAF